MAAVATRKYLANQFPNQVCTERVVYDFAVDAGATGALDLWEASDAVVVIGFHTIVKTACTSGGSATVKVGHTDDDDAFCTIVQGAVASLTAAAHIVPPVVLSEGTPNTAVFPVPVKLAAAKKILMTIGTAALTAGKIEFVVQYIKL